MSGLLGFHTPANYTTSTLASRWAVANDLAIDSNDGYDGGPAITGASADGYGLLPARGISDPQTFIVGRRFKYTSAPSSEKPILGVCAADHSILSIAVMLTDGRVAVYRGDREQLFCITAAALTASSQLRIGLACFMAPGAAGWVRLYLDGAILAQASGVDTGSSPWALVYTGATTAMFHSQLYWGDDGIVRPGVLGERKASSNTNLDEADHDGEATVEDLGEDESLATTVSSVSSRRLIYGFQTSAVVRHTSAAAGWRPQVTIGGGLYTADRQPIDTTFRAVDQFYATSPATGVRPTSAELTAAAFKIGGKAVA